MKPNTKKILKFTLPTLGILSLGTIIGLAAGISIHNNDGFNKLEVNPNVNKAKIGFNDYNYNFNVSSDQSESIPLNVENAPNENCISYYITSPELKLSHFLISSGTKTFKVPQTLIDYVNNSSEGYLSFDLIAQYKSENQIVESQPTLVTLYKTQDLTNNNESSLSNPNQATNLFCLPSNSLTKQFDIGSNINIKLILGLQDEQQVKQWQIVRLANDVYNSTTSIVNNVNPDINLETSQKEFSYKVLPGWQQIVIKAIGNDNQVLGVSNTINLEGVQTMKMTLSSPSLNTGLVEIGQSTSTDLNFDTNILDFQLSTSNIYYQNTTTNNQWVSLANKTPTNFHLEINGDTLHITHMTGNYATNFKVIDPIHQLRTNIVTVSSYVAPSVYQPKIQINGEDLTDSQFVLSEKPSFITLTNTNNYNSSLLTQTWYVVNPEGKWEKIGEGNSVNYKLIKNGSYRFKLSLTWKNLISSPSYNQTFNVVIKNDDTLQILKEKSALFKWVKEPENIKSAILSYFKQNPNWLTDYMGTWGNGYRLTLNQDNIGKILGEPQILVDKNNNYQLILKTKILSTLQAQQYRGNTTLSFKPGDTLYVGLPFYLQNTKGYSITPSVDEAGYSWLNISINPNKMHSNKQLAWYVCEGNTNKVIKTISINLSVLPKYYWKPININHYQAESIPQTIDDLAPLFNLD